MTQGALTVLAVLSENMLALFEVYESPVLRFGLEYDVASPAAVSPVRSSLRDILRTVEMHRTRSAVSRPAEYLYVVYEIAVCHK